MKIKKRQPVKLDANDSRNTEEIIGCKKEDQEREREREQPLSLRN